MMVKIEITVKETLKDWIDWLEKSLGRGITWINDLDKAELLDLLKELERRRTDKDSVIQIKIKKP